MAGAAFGVERVAATGSGRMSDIGRDFGVGLLSVVVGISMEDDLLKREAKLERLDVELPVRTGDCLAASELVGTWCSAGVADEERDGSSCCSSDSWGV